ncbi:M15 family metallopeptidase [uncultured Alistipes sp.]|uniref:M15 family metallopeptidase n=1 Tax=uncultured Alistipes sp. TaxID=538949 RepID=UPI0025854BF8|nr:M15 family metallopeptidase [uncultured Alistipes sp.]
MTRKLLLAACALLLCAVVRAQGGLDRKMQAAGLVDVLGADSTLRVRLMYSTADNFMGRDVYGDLETAYLLPHFAAKVVRAQNLLRRRKPGWRLLVCDAARPISVQRLMYSLVEGTPNQVYVANGARGGRHNYGVAVDVTLLDASGREADMGTPVDFFGEEAHTGNDAALVAAGKISAAAARNRELLRSVMREAGLVPYRREWWHYEEPMPMPEVRERFRLLDF